MDAQRGLSVSGHRNTVLCLHLTSDTYHVTPSGRAPRARGKFWIRRVKLRIFRPDPKSHKSEGFPAAQIFKTHKCQNTYCRSAHFSKAVKFVGAQNHRGTTCSAPTQFRGLPLGLLQLDTRPSRALEPSDRHLHTPKQPFHFKYHLFSCRIRPSPAVSGRFRGRMRVCANCAIHACMPVHGG